MRKQHLLLKMLFLFLLVPTSITRAQTVTLSGTVYENQTAKSTFTTPQGNIKVYLPDDMAAGDMISGTVVTEPLGKTEKEKKKNLAALLKYVVSFAGGKFPVTADPNNIFFTLSHTDRQLTSPLELMNVSGSIAGELKLPVFPTQPVFSLLINSTLTPASNVIVKGQPLALSSNGKFSSATNFTVTDANGKTAEVKPICSSPRTAVINLPPDMSAGNITVKSNDAKPSSCKIRLIDILVRASKTNLQRGEKSVLLATIDPKITDKDSAEAMQIPIMSLDIKNLNPNNVSLQGGDAQRTSFPLGNRNDAASWTIQRTLTGITPGNFSVNVSLNNDYNISNDPFHPQKNVLNTLEDFNAWAGALKKDLKNYASKQGTDQMGKVAKANAERAIENMPDCFDKNKLDECKAMADALMRPVNIPKGAATLWLSGFEAYKAAYKAFTTGLAGKAEIIDWDVIRNGLEIIKRMGEQLKDDAIQSGANDAKNLIAGIQNAGETKNNLQELKNKLEELNKNTDGKIGNNPYSNFYVVTLSDIMVSGYSVSPGVATDKLNTSNQRVNTITDLIGFLDPFRKVLFVVPTYKDQLLGMLNAKPQPGGNYLIQSLTPSRKQVSYTIAVIYANPQKIFDIGNNVNKGLLCELNTIDSSKRVTIGKDVFIDPDATFKDKNGTTYRFYKNAECKLTDEARKTEECEADSDYKPDAKEGEPKIVSNGKYAKYEFIEQWQCVKGSEICIEGIYVMVIKYIYQDPGCKKLIDVEKTYSINCH